MCNFLFGHLSFLILIVAIYWST